MIRLRSTVVWIGALTTMSALSGCVTLGIGQTGATAGAPTAVTTSAASSTSAAAPSSRPSDPTTNPPRGTGVSNSPTTSKIAPPPPDNATPPGTELKIGQPAISSYDSLGQVNNVEVTIVSITKGKQADLVNFDIKDAALKLATPFYVVSQYKLLAGETVKVPIMDGRVGATDQNGSRISSLTILGTLPQCEGDRLRELAVGATYKDCKVFMAPPGSEVVSVTWSGSYTAKPFVWKP